MTVKELNRIPVAPKLTGRLRAVCAALAKLVTAGRSKERHGVTKGQTDGSGHYRSVVYDGFRRRLAEVISQMLEKPSATLPGTVVKIIKSPFPGEPDKAEITVEGADHLFREIRIDNTLTNGRGEEVSLKLGAEVEVTVEAVTTPKNSQ